MGRLDLESIDLAELATVLVRACGPAVSGEVVGRTLLRDEVVRHLGCSQLEAEGLVDTLIGRGFVVRRDRDGLAMWVVVTRP